MSRAPHRRAACGTALPCAGLRYPAPPRRTTHAAAAPTHPRPARTLGVRLQRALALALLIVVRPAVQVCVNLLLTCMGSRQSSSTQAAFVACSAHSA